MKVVFVAPHPDDVELFAGGTAIKHSAGGDETVKILLTMGELGALFEGKNLAERREREAREGASIIGVSKLRFLGIRDRRVGLDEGTSEKIRRAVAKENPE